MSSRFALGRCMATPSVLEALDRGALHDLLVRHARGDWGDLDEHDRAANDRAVVAGDRILSAYRLADLRIYVITEADRSATTLLFPEEY